MGFRGHLVYTKYWNASTNASNLTGFATSLLSAFGLSAPATGETGTAASALNAYGGFIAGGGYSSDGTPKGFLTILTFDNNYNLVSANTTFQQISTLALQPNTPIPPTSTPFEHLSKQMTITQPGYVYIFVSNEDPNLTDIYFDDLTINHKRSPVVAGSDFYPFGMPMENRSITRESYRYGYQGQYSEMDSVTKWNAFELRMYDPSIGRWLSPDTYGQFASPYVGMGNLPHMGTDPTGGLFGFDDVLSGALIGAAVGTGIGLAVDPKHWYDYTMGGAGLGALGGAIYDASTYDLTGIGRTGRNPGGAASTAASNAFAGSVGGNFSFVSPSVAIDVAAATARLITPTVPAPATTVSGSGIKFIAQWEGFSSSLYNDIANNATIGFGTLAHMGPINGSEPQEFKDGITRGRGFELLEDRALDAADAVNDLIDVTLNQNQFDAITSLIYNIGRGNFVGSAARQLINSGTATRGRISNAIRAWNKVVINGVKQESYGLIRRRSAEARLYFRGR